MKAQKEDPYCIDVYDNDGKESYSYSVKVLLAPGEAQTCGGADLFGTPKRSIKITRKAYRLAVLRNFPDTESEVKDIISFSEGNRIKLSIVERLVLVFSNG